jgi:hypothetical protein
MSKSTTKTTQRNKKAEVIKGRNQENKEIQ